MRQLLKADVQVVSSESLSEDACSSVRRLKVLRRFKQNAEALHKNTHFCFLQESDVRIIIGHFEEDFASEVFCCVSKSVWTLLWSVGWQLFDLMLMQKHTVMFLMKHDLQPFVSNTFSALTRPCVLKVLLLSRNIRGTGTQSQLIDETSSTLAAVMSQPGRCTNNTPMSEVM